MPTISNTPRPGYAYDSTDDVWYPIGTGPHTHPDYITQSTAINPSIVDAKGDLIVGSAADTVIRKAVGTDGQLLYADSTATGGIKWDAAPASGSMTLLSTTTLTGASVTISNINQTYTNLFIVTRNATLNNNNDYIRVNFNGSSGQFLGRYALNSGGSATDSVGTFTDFRIDLGIASWSTPSLNSLSMTISNYTDTSTYKVIQGTGAYRGNNGSNNAGIFGGAIWNSSAISSMTIYSQYSSFTGGTVLIYGVN